MLNYSVVIKHTITKLHEIYILVKMERNLGHIAGILKYDDLV